MILQILKEEIDNLKLAKEYKSAYSDIPENDFMTMVKMDPSSYPKNGSEYDLSQEPIKVGNLASGGSGGLLIRCYRKGDTNFLSDFNRVQNACDKFLKNRSSYSYKNAGVFSSVQQFVDYVESDGKMEIDVSEPTQVKKSNNPKDKLEQLRAKQFPNIASVEDLILVADLDEESDTDHGQVGTVAKTLLLPHYAAGDTEFMTKKVAVKKAIQKYYNASSDQVSENPISKYNEKEGNTYIRSINDFINDWGVQYFKDSNLKNLLKEFAKEDEYSIWGSTQNYDIIEYHTANVGHILDICDVTPQEIKSKFGHAEDPIYAACSEYDSSSHSSGMVTNVWCTGWPGSLVDRYASDACTLVAFICRDRIPFEKECYKNWQVSIYKKSGDFNDIEDGNNNHAGWSANITGFLSMLEQNKSVLSILMAHSPFNKSSRIVDLANRLNVKPSENGAILDNVEMVEFEYSSSADISRYKDSTDDINCLNIYTLKIKDGVEKIPDFEFQNWKNLDKIYFPESLKEIGNKSFAGCSSLVRLNLPSNLETIGLGAFEGCSGLRGSIRLPLNIRKIEQNAFAFHNKKGLKFVISPKRLDGSSNIPLLLPEEDHDFWFTPGRIKFSDN